MRPLPPRDLLRTQIEGGRRAHSGLVGRLIRCLSKDARSLARLDDELAQVRFGHLHELERLRALLDERSLGPVAEALSLEAGAEPRPR